MKAKILLLILTNSIFLLLLNGCSHIPLEDSAVSVKVYYSLAEKTKAEETNCEYIGDAIGSDGNFVTFLFMTNVSLTKGALNDIRNEVIRMGGDTIFILHEQLLYTTSTTFVGSVYNCHK
jgi:hypothetical protein